MDQKQKITVAQLDTILSPESPVTYWQNDMPVSRRDIFDDCEVIAVELDESIINGRAKPCISVYVGKRASQQEA